MRRIYQEFLRKKKPAGMNYGASTILTLGLKFMPDKKHQNGRFRGSLMLTNAFSQLVGDVNGLQMHVMTKWTPWVGFNDEEL